MKNLILIVITLYSAFAQAQVSDIKVGELTDMPPCNPMNLEIIKCKENTFMFYNIDQNNLTHLDRFESHLNILDANGKPKPLDVFDSSNIEHVFYSSATDTKLYFNVKLKSQNDYAIEYLDCNDLKLHAFKKEDDDGKPYCDFFNKNRALPTIRILPTTFLICNGSKSLNDKMKEEETTSFYIKVLDKNNESVYKSQLLTVPFKSKHFMIMDAITDKENNIFLECRKTALTYGNNPKAYIYFYYDSKTDKLNQVEAPELPDNPLMIQFLKLMNDNFGNAYIIGYYVKTGLKGKSREFVYPVVNETVKNPIVVNQEDYKDDDGKEISAELLSINLNSAGQVVLVYGNNHTIGGSPNTATLFDNESIFTLVFNNGESSPVKQAMLHRYNHWMSDRVREQSIFQEGDDLYIIYNDDVRNKDQGNITGLEKYDRKSPGTAIMLARINLLTGKVEKSPLFKSFPDGLDYFFETEQFKKVGDKNYQGMITTTHGKQMRLLAFKAE